MSYSFPLIDQQLSIRLNCDLSSVKPDKVTIVETPRRLTNEKYFSYIRAPWWMWLADGRSVLSVPPGSGEEIRRLISNIQSPAQLQDTALAEALKIPVNKALLAEGCGEIDEKYMDFCFSCNGELLRQPSIGDCRRLTDAAIPHTDGLWWPNTCITEGIAYGVIVHEQVVAIAHAHCTAIMPDQVADVAVCTAEAYRRRGFAQLAVSALVAHMARLNGEARYTCGVENIASIATARSVGFVEYGVSLLLLAPLKESK